MSPRDNSKVRKPAVKKKKSAWDMHKNTIIRLYKDKTLEEVMKTMEDSYGFRANKRQYVYRLQIWEARKYNSPLPEAEHSHSFNPDVNGAPPSPFRGQGSPSSPAHDVGEAYLDSINHDNFSLPWIMKMKPRTDALLVLPRNKKAFDDYKNLQESTPSVDKTGTIYKAIVDACVFSALADNVDSEREDRVDTTRSILAGTTEILSGEVDTLRRRLQLHALQPQIEGGSGSTHTLNMMEDVIFRRNISDDLNMFLLLTLFGSSFGPTAMHEKRILGRYVQSLRNSQKALSILRGSIEWCKSICNGLALDPQAFDIKCTNPNEHVQLNMAKVSCLLSTKLLSDNEELPTWAQNIEDNLGTSKTTFAVALVCMAWDHSERCSSPVLDSVSPYQRVYHGLEMLTTIQPMTDQPSTIWRMFLRAFVQVHKVAFTGHIHTFPSTATDLSPCSEDFIEHLSEAVVHHISLCPPSELSETTSVSNDPLSPTFTQDGDYSPQMYDLPDYEEFQIYPESFFSNPLENVKDFHACPHFDVPPEVGLN